MIKKICWFYSLLLHVVAVSAQTNYFLPSKKDDVTDVHQPNVRGVVSTPPLVDRKLKSKKKKTSTEEDEPKAKEEDEPLLALCVLDKDGYSIEAGSKNHKKGDILHANSITAMEASEGTADMLTSMAGIASLLDRSNIEGDPSFFQYTGKRKTQVDDFIIASSMDPSIFSIASIIVGINSNNDDFVEPSQSLIKNKFMNSTVDNIDLLSRHVDELYEGYIQKVFLSNRDSTLLDEMNTQLHRITSAYSKYIVAATQMDSVAETDYPDVADKLHSLPTIVYRERFRMVCNEFVTPEDIIGALYGHACNSDTGNCDYPRSLCLAGLEEFKEWIVGSMILASFLQQACLPPELNFCPFENDPIQQGSIDKSIDSLREVLVLLEDPETCSTVNQQGLALCRVDDRGYPIPEESPQYVNGINVYSPQVTAVGLQENIGPLLSDIGKITNTFAGAISNLGKAGEAIGAALGIVAGSIQIAALIMGRNEPDPTILFLKEQFRITNRKIDRLSHQISEIYDQLRKDIGDVILDRLNNQLFRTANAYKDYINATTIDETTIEPRKLQSIRHIYREKFRIACNELDYTPKDIIGILYGHACGDKDKYQPGGRCGDFNGVNTGACEHGIKQRTYLLDTFRKGGSVANIKGFMSWMVGAMVQGLFLQAVCLPPDINVCPNEDDPIFKGNMDTSVAALQEVIEVITATEQCTCPCKKIFFKEFSIIRDFYHERGDHADGWPWVGYKFSDGDGKPEENFSERLNPGYFNYHDDSGRGIGVVDEDGRFKKTYNNYINFRSSLTQEHWLHFSFEQRDHIEQYIINGTTGEPISVSGGKSFKYFLDIPSNRNSPDGWYNSTCEPYTKTFNEKFTDANSGDIEYVLEFRPADRCPTNFCSTDKPCPDGKICDGFRCQTM